MDNLRIAKVIVDLENFSVCLEGKDGTIEYHDMDTEEGFLGITEAWIRSGWYAKHLYSFTWLGRPIIQLPDDMIRMQEVIFTLKPDVIIETGIAHGGSLIFYASLCKAMGKGRIVGIDIEIRQHNREAIEEHPLYSFITMIEGDSLDIKVIEEVKSYVSEGDTVLVLLDSNHTKKHVLGELIAYSPLVSIGSYIVATDGVMAQVAGGPRASKDWYEDNPQTAAKKFVAQRDDFIIEEPEFIFNEGMVTKQVTHWPDAYIKRIK